MSENVTPEVIQHTDLAPTIITVLIATTARQTRNTLRLAFDLHTCPPSRVASALIRPNT